jgi:hypothetical protein
VPRRADDDLALLRVLLACEHAQERGLARAVGADQPDDVTRGDDQVEIREEDVGAVSRGEPGGLDGGAHVVAHATACRDRLSAVPASPVIADPVCLRSCGSQ